eukprot:scaffold576_cov260-Pinguiococcus_pyrenoidosus.AAC.31
MESIVPSTFASSATSTIRSSLADAALIVHMQDKRRGGEGKIQSNSNDAHGGRARPKLVRPEVRATQARSP